MNYLIGSVGLAFLGLGLVWLKINTPEGAHHRPPWWQRWRDRRQHERAQDALNLRLLHDIGEGLRREATGPLTSSGMPAADAFHPPLPVDEAAERAMWGEHYGQPGEPGWEGTDEEYAAAMAAGRPVSLNAEQARARGWDTDAPLMPLPPEVERTCFHPEGWGDEEPDDGMVHMYQLADGQIVPAHDPGEPCGCPEREPCPADCPHWREVANPLAILGDDAEPEDPHDVATPGTQADALVGPVQPPWAGRLDERGMLPTHVGWALMDQGVELPEDWITCPLGPAYPHLREGQYAEATGQFSRAVLDEYERSMAGGAG
jgi:hypothetical protein